VPIFTEFPLYIVEWYDYRRTGKDLEGSDRDIFEILSRHLPGGDEKIHE
jgi:hypothetical protein